MALAAPLPLDRALFPVTGADAESFLQNLLTQDLARLASARVIYAGLLTPQGKVAFDFMLWREGEGYVVDVAAHRATDLARRLALYRLRAKVDIGPVSQTHGVWAAPAGATPDPRLPALGARDIAPLARAPHEEPEAYRALRIVLGVPDLTRDAGPEEAFALEALFEEFNGVDFQKGCFVGQENVSRMKRRATTRRKFCPVAFAGPAPPFGAEITASDAALGSVRGAIEGRALAFLRLDRAAEAASRGIGLVAAGVALRLDPPPWLIQPAAPAE
jgi:folate-binding protein YgfZ